MARVKWDAVGERYFETGVDHGMFYDLTDSGEYTGGVPWNGLTGVTETPSGAEPNDLWADNIKYLSIRSAETFGGTIECYTYPDKFKACNGEAELTKGIYVGQQQRKRFGFSFRTIKGNDQKSTEFGYKLHLVYGAMVSPSDSGYQTVNDSPDAITLSYEFDTVPVEVGTGFKPTALLVVDSTLVDPEKLKALEDKLYGTDGTVGEEGTGTDPVMPLPEEVANIFAAG